MQIQVLSFKTLPSQLSLWFSFLYIWDSLIANALEISHCHGETEHSISQSGLTVSEGLCLFGHYRTGTCWPRSDYIYIGLYWRDQLCPKLLTQYIIESSIFEKKVLNLERWNSIIQSSNYMPPSFSQEHTKNVYFLDQKQFGHMSFPPPLYFSIYLYYLECMKIRNKICRAIWKWYLEWNCSQPNTHCIRRTYFDFFHYPKTDKWWQL